MNLSVVVTHRFELPAVLVQFLTAALVHMGELPRTNSPGAAGTTAPRPIEPRTGSQGAPAPVTQLAPPAGAPVGMAQQFAPSEPARPAQTVEAAQPAADTSVPPAGVKLKRNGQPYAERKPRQPRAVAQEIPTVQPTQQVMFGQPAAQPAPATQWAAPAAPAADPFARPAAPVAPAVVNPFATAPAAAVPTPQPFSPPAGHVTAPAIPAATQQGGATVDDLKRAFENLLFSGRPDAEALIAGVMSRHSLQAVNQAQPAQYPALITDLLAAVHAPASQ